MSTRRPSTVGHDATGEGIMLRTSRGRIFLSYSDARGVADFIHDFMENHETTNRNGNHSK